MQWMPPVPPPPPEEPAPVEAVKPEPELLPELVVIPKGTRIAVALDTPLSTRDSRPGHVVKFRTLERLPLHAALELPPGTHFSGRIVSVRRPGAFGRPGELRVEVNRVQLSNGTEAGVVARLESADGSGVGRVTAEANRSTDLFTLVALTAQGTLLGARIRRGKGAALGAGAGAAAGLILLMSRRGPDLDIEPGKHFLLMTESAVELPSADVARAQQDYERIHGPAPASPEEDPTRPKLKRRPKNP
jgi:hypothetical protein